MRRILSKGLEELKIPFTDGCLDTFEKYAAHLELKNSVMNLTAIEGGENVARLHFLDCAALLSVWDFPEGASVIDVGAGAGFPGVPLKLLRPDISLTLLDSQKKRVGFLEEVRDMLGLENVTCLADRAEEIAGDIGGSFDIAVSRAVARLNILCELCLPFLHVGGTFIAMKGPDCSQELEEAGHAIKVLGGGQALVRAYTIPGTDITHSAVIIEKKRPTPPAYPRQFGKIKKSPL